MITMSRTERTNGEHKSIIRRHCHGIQAPDFDWSNMINKLVLSFPAIWDRRLVINCGFSLLCLSLTASVQAAPAFEITELDTGQAVDQTVMTAFLENEGQADLIVISVSGESEKKLELYELSGNGFSGSASVVTPLAEDVISVDIGRFRQRDILVTFTDHEAIGYDPRTGIKRTLIQYQSIHNTPIRDSVPNPDLFRDINKDGLDDFFIPGFKGMTAYIQMDDGEFSEGIAMYAPPVMRMSPGTANYQMPGNYLADMNTDGLQDVVFWVDEHLSFYAGRPDGLFESEATGFDSRVPYRYGSMEDMDREMNEKQRI